MIVAAAASLVFLIWKRVTVPALSTGGQELFPDAGLLSELIVVAVVLLGFALADRYVQIVIDAIVVRPFRRLTGSND
ncbi:hypothetical protein CAter10_1828 [Collimonas arenae]|nr:hypothetical protein [Collimonas arenae]AMO99578.1 hypothetical protein CAter10_1828 [Collimonas arenae]